MKMQKQKCIFISFSIFICLTSKIKNQSPSLCYTPTLFVWILYEIIQMKTKRSFDFCFPTFMLTMLRIKYSRWQCALLTLVQAINPAQLNSTQLTLFHKKFKN